MSTALLTFTGFHYPFSKGLVGEEEQPGPILTLVREMAFDRVILFSTPATTSQSAATQHAIAEVSLRTAVPTHQCVGMDIRLKTENVLARIRWPIEPELHRAVRRLGPCSDLTSAQIRNRRARFTRFEPITYTSHQAIRPERRTVPDQVWPQVLVSPKFRRARTQDFGRTRNIGRAGHEVLAQDTKNWQ